MSSIFTPLANALRKPLARAGVAAVLVPTVALAIVANLAEDMPDEEAMAVAASVVRSYVHDNPPNGAWQATSVKVGPERRITVEVNVPVFKQAQAIRTRKNRVKYSYLKLACPAEGAAIHNDLPKDVRVWVKLHHYGEVLVEAPCPRSRGGATLTG